MGSRKKLRPYQREARDFILRTGVGGCLFMEMRLGKTLTALRVASRELWKNANAKILIVGPNSTHKGWIEDLASEGHIPVHVQGTPKQKEKALQQVSNFYLLNKEGHVKGHRNKIGKMVWEPLDGLLEMGWDMIILDESHFIKNPSSGVSKFFLKHFNNVPTKICLTGTPFENNELDFVQQYLFILGDKAPFDFWKFRAVYTVKRGYEHYLNKGGKKVLADLATGLAFSLRRKDVNMDKEKIFEVRTVELPPKAKKVYKKVLEEFILEYNETRKITKYIVEQFTIMRRICGGFVPIPAKEEGEPSTLEFIHDAKLRELHTILDENFKGEPVLIFANYRAEILAIEEYLTKKKMKCKVLHGGIKIGPKRWALEKQFKNREFDYFIVQPQTVKEGVDLSTASTSIYYSLPSGYINWKQTQDRILSLQKEGSLLIIVLEVVESIETNMWKKIEGKTTREDIILSILHNNNAKK